MQPKTSSTKPQIGARSKLPHKNIISPQLQTMYNSPYRSPLVSGATSRTPSLQRTKSDPGFHTPKFLTLNDQTNIVRLNDDDNNEDILKPLNPKHRTMTVPANLSDWHHPSIVLELLLNLPMECHMGIGDNLKPMIDAAIAEQTQLEHEQCLIEQEELKTNIVPPAPLAIPPTAVIPSNKLLNDDDKYYEKRPMIQSGDGALTRKPSIKQFESVLQEGYTKNLIIAILQALIGALLSGYNTSILNVPSSIIISECNLTMTTYSSLQSFFCLGGLIGALSIGKIADKFGRKCAIIIFDIIYILSGILNMAYGYNIFGTFNESTFVIFAIARCLCGIGAGIASGIIPTYLGEISPPLIRGTIGTLYQLTVCFGLISSELLGYYEIFGNELLWPWLFILNIILPFIQLFTLWSFPESPKWLITKNEEEEARKIFCYLRQCSNVDMDLYFMKTVNKFQETVQRRKTLSIHTLSSITDIADIVNDLDAKNMNYGSIKPHISTIKSQKEIPAMKTREQEMNKILLWSVVIAIALQIMQQFSGINSVFYYSNSTLVSAGFTTPFNLWIGNILIAFANFCSVLIPVKLMDKLGRKILLNISLCGMIVSSIGFSLTLMYNTANGTSSGYVGYLSLIFLIFYVISFEIGLGPIPWLMMAEISPSLHRATIVSIATFINWGSNLIIAQFANIIVSELQFFPFAVVCLFGVIFTYKCIPETKGKTEMEIQKQLLQR